MTIENPSAAVIADVARAIALSDYCRRHSLQPREVEDNFLDHFDNWRSGSTGRDYTRRAHAAVEAFLAARAGGEQ